MSKNVKIENLASLVILNTYNRQDQQGKAAFNERNAHATRQQEPVARSQDGACSKVQSWRRIQHLQWTGYFFFKLKTCIYPFTEISIAKMISKNPFSSEKLVCSTIIFFSVTELIGKNVCFVFHNWRQSFTIGVVQLVLLIKTVLKMSLAEHLKFLHQSINVIITNTSYNLFR
jgi:hypothetical protein